MRPERKSRLLLGVTRSKAKMLEYSVPKEHHIRITQDPARLFTISIGLLGELAAKINRDESDTSSFSELKSNLLFAARFFDSYLQSRLNEALDPYLVLLGSASYYLCDLPGSAAVLAKRIEGDCPNLEAGGLEDLLLWLLRSDQGNNIRGDESPLGEYIVGISRRVLQFFEDGTGEGALLDEIIKLRKSVYELGTPRELFLGDVIVAVIRRKIENSVWKALPVYSGLTRNEWLPVLQKESSIRELWPALRIPDEACH